MASRRQSNAQGRAARVFGGVLLVPLMVVATYLGICLLLLVCYRFVNPPITGVQLQRQIEALVDGRQYSRDYRPVGEVQIARHLKRAAIAAEDGRFLQHGGVDWEAVRKAREEMQRGRRVRGGSTITQQLVKNLFMTTHRSWIRKGFEVPLAYAAEFILGKDRILVLYLNVIEWGDGIYGAEAAALHHYKRSASELTRAQAAGLAACIPAPRSRTPQRTQWYANIILTRMSQMGW
jgi:monofunctional glycosyltransferase